MHLYWNLDRLGMKKQPQTFILFDTKDTICKVFDGMPLTIEFQGRSQSILGRHNLRPNVLEALFSSFLQKMVAAQKLFCSSNFSRVAHHQSVKSAFP